MDELKKNNHNHNQEINDDDLMAITIQDEFEDYYTPPIPFKVDLVNKTQILKKYKKEDSVLKFENS